VSQDWHAEPVALRDYIAARIDEAGAASIEAHLPTCWLCRRSVATLIGLGPIATPMSRIWGGIEERTDPVGRGAIERLAVGLGLPEHIARLLAATRSLRLSWFAAMSIALGFAALAAHGGTDGLLLFLIVAPLVPLAGVAAAYGPGVDPAYEVGLAAPMRSFRLLLIRSIAVLAASIVLAAAAALALPHLDWTAAAWLVPSLALTLATLALSTYVSSLRAAVGVAGGWVAAVLVTEGLSGGRLAAFGGIGQIAFVIVALVAATILANRRDAIDRRIA
jgi:hypothetical protein